MILLSFIQQKYEELNKLSTLESNYRKTSIEILGVTQQAKKLRLDEILREMHQIRLAIREQKNSDIENYTSPLAQFLSGRDKDEHLVAEKILYDDLEFKYKSDKVKAFLKAGIIPSQIALILSMRPETNVTVSYIESIKKSM